MRVAAILLCFSLPCHDAEAANENLAGLKQVSYLVGGVDKDAEQCSLNREALKGSLRLPIQAYTKVTDPGDFFGPMLLTLTITTIDAGRTCATYIQLELSAFEIVKLPYMSAPSKEVISVWSDGHLNTSPKNDAGKSVRDAVEGLRQKIRVGMAGGEPVARTGHG